jgi:hypothetical protein
MGGHTFFKAEIEKSPQIINPEMIMLVFLGCLSASVLMTVCLIHYFCMRGDFGVHRRTRPTEPTYPGENEGVDPSAGLQI